MTKHESVLLHECIEWLNIRPDGIYVDATFGAGGHSLLMASKLSTGKVFGFDQDEDSVIGFPGHPSIVTVRSNFRFIRHFLKYYQALPVDGILADLGISSHHIDSPDRGFSFRFDAPLDMRMNQASGKTAADVVNNNGAEHLSEIFRKYGEIDQAFRIAGAVVKARENGPIKTTFELAEIVTRFARPGRENSLLAQVFQAIRIEVNQEMSVLEEFLNQAYHCLRPGGRLVILSYHSLEDRMVKNFFRKERETDAFSRQVMGKRDMLWKNLTGTAIVPSTEELTRNPRSRSAKLRAAEKI